MLVNGNLFHGDHHPVSVVEGRKSRNYFPSLEGLKYTTTNGGVFSNVKIDGSRFTCHMSAPNSGWTNFQFASMHELIPDAVGKPMKLVSVGCVAGVKIDGEPSKNHSIEWKFNASESVEITQVYWETLTPGEHDVDCYIMIVEDTDDAPTAYEAPGTVTDTIFKPTNLKKSGTSLTFEKSYNHAAEVEVAGKSEQVQLSGKNLLNIHRSEVIDKPQPNGTGYGYNRPELRPFNENQAWFGMSMNNYFYVNNIIVGEIGDDYVRVLSKSSGYGFAYPVKVTPGSKYTLSFENNAEVDANHFGVGFYDESGANLSFVQTKTFTVPANAVWATICMRPAQNIEITFKKPQLELGSTATQYEPYCGGIPSPNPEYPQEIKSIDSVKLVSRGRNLLNTDASKWAGKTYALLELQENTRYRMDVSLKDGATIPSDLYIGFSSGDWASSGVSIGPWAVQGGQVRMDNVYNNVGASNPNNGVFQKYVAVYPKKYASQIDSIFDIQVEQGIYKHPYEPYHSTTRTIDLQGNQLRSLPDGTHDTLVVKRTGECWIEKRVGELTHNVFGSLITLDSGLKAVASSVPGKIYETTDGAIMCDKALYEPTRKKPWTFYENPVNVVFVGGQASTREELVNNFTGANLIFKLATQQIITLLSIDPLPTYWPTTVIYDEHGNDVSCYVKVID